MKKIIFMGSIILGLCTAACSSSRAEGNSVENGLESFFSSNKIVTASRTYVTKNISVANFDAIRAMGSFNVEYKHGERSRVELYVPDNILPLIEYQVHDRELLLRMKPNTGISWGSENKSKITVYSPSVKNFTLIGSGNLTVNEPLSGERNYNFQLTGSGDLNVRDVKASNGIRSNLSGSGDLNFLAMEAKGEDGIALALAGSGDLNVNVLKSRAVSASISGSGDLNVASINADATTASIAGSGDMRLKGKTNRASFSVSGSGELSAGQLKAKDVNASAVGSGEIICYATGQTNFQSVHKSSIQNVAR